MRLRLMAGALALLIAPLSGCIGGDDEPVDAQAAAGDLGPALAFGPATAMAQTVFGAEPNIAVLPDGTLFITAPVGLQSTPNAVQGAAYLWRSRDGGSSWETVRGPIELPAPVPVLGTFGPFCSCDADVVGSPDGWVYYSDWWDGNYLVERSPDGGDSWMPAPVTTPDALVLLNVDRQWLVAGPDGFVGLFYATSDRTRPGAGPFGLAFGSPVISAVFSRDHGATWGLPVHVVGAEAGTFNQIAHPFLLPDGQIVMPYGHMTSADGEFWKAPASVHVAVSSDEGATWTSSAVAELDEGFDNLWAVQGAADATGRIHVAWAARAGERMHVSLSASTDGGATWSAPHALSSKGINFLPWVTASGDGRVAVGWYGGDAKGDPAEAPGETEWFPFVAERAAAGAPWTTARVTDEPVKAGPMCPRGSSCGGDRELLDYVSLVYAPDGRLHYAFARSGEGTGGPAAVVHHAARVLPSA